MLLWSLLAGGHGLGHRAALQYRLPSRRTALHCERRLLRWSLHERQLRRRDLGMYTLGGACDEGSDCCNLICMNGLCQTVVK